MGSKDEKNIPLLGGPGNEKQIREQLRNESVRQYITVIPAFLQLLVFFSLNREFYLFAILPLCAIYLFVTYEPSAKFCRVHMLNFQRNMWIYVIFLFGCAFLTVVTGSAVWVFVSMLSMLIFFIYFDRSWRELQKQWGVKEDEWFRKQ